MNYYELIYLKKFVKNNFKGSKVILVTTAFKNVVDFIVSKNGNDHKLTFSTAPGNLALFANSQISIKKSNQIRFFEEIYQYHIIDVWLDPHDRILSFKLEDEYKLIFKIYGNNANVFLTSNDKLISAFKDGDTELPIPRGGEPLKEMEENLPVKKKINLLNPRLPRTHLDDLIALNDLEDLSVNDIRLFVGNLDNQLRNHPKFRLVKGNNTTLFNEEILPLKTKQYFDGINDLVEYRYKNHIYFQLFRQDKAKYEKAIQRLLRRTYSSLKNLENADIGLERAELYEKYGHLLMANGHLNLKGEKTITVADLYEEGKEIQIPLDETKNLIQNAEHYYERAKNSAISFEEAVERIPILENRREELTKLLTAMDEIEELYELRDWEKENKSVLERFGLNQKTKIKQSDSLFHTYELNNYTIWIGKNAKNNDLLVKMGHKEDVWLHARGVPGSHVLIRMNNNRDLPPAAVINKAAAFAAFNSKAKGSDLVPVIYTKKKFVRKPKNAAPGAVVVEKENVEFVTPLNPENENL